MWDVADSSLFLILGDKVSITIYMYNKPLCYKSQVYLTPDNEIFKIKNKKENMVYSDNQENGVRGKQSQDVVTSEAVFPSWYWIHASLTCWSNVRRWRDISIF